MIDNKISIFHPSNDIWGCTNGFEVDFDEKNETKRQKSQQNKRRSESTSYSITNHAKLRLISGYDTNLKG
jgi:hypothetical protein